MSKKQFLALLVMIALLQVVPVSAAKKPTPTPTPTPSLGGSGTVGQVAFWDGISSLAGDSNLFWDNNAKRLGIGTISPEALVDIDVTNMMTNGAMSKKGININHAGLTTATVYGIYSYVNPVEQRDTTPDAYGGYFEATADVGADQDGKAYGVYAKTTVANGYSVFADQTDPNGHALYTKGGKNYMENSLKIGSSSKRTGITLHDEITGNPYCLSIANGATKVVTGNCL